MIWFKERVTIVTMYKHWIWKKGVADTPLSLITFLQIKGWLNEDKIKLDFGITNNREYPKTSLEDKIKISEVEE
ncbi:MAG: hypothetical protein IJI87_03205 [Mogibacterium sp.]|nr:hypothetical protein [Mogibacterium sp.]